MERKARTIIRIPYKTPEIPPVNVGKLLPLNQLCEVAPTFLKTGTAKYSYTQHGILVDLRCFSNFPGKTVSDVKNSFLTILKKVQVTFWNSMVDGDGFEYKNTILKTVITVAGLLDVPHISEVSKSPEKYTTAFAIVSIVYHMVAFYAYGAHEHMTEAEICRFFDDVYLDVAETVSSTILRNTLIYCLKLHNVFPTHDIYGILALDIFGHDEPLDTLSLVFEAQLGHVLGSYILCKNSHSEPTKDFVLIKALNRHYSKMSPFIFHWCLHTIPMNHPFWDISVYTQVNALDTKNRSREQKSFNAVYVGVIASSPLNISQKWLFNKRITDDYAVDKTQITPEQLEHMMHESFKTLATVLYMQLVASWRSMNDRRKMLKPPVLTGVFYCVFDEIVRVIRDCMLMGNPADGDTSMFDTMRHYMCRSSSLGYFCPEYSPDAMDTS
ncbi:MAG: hypothetical protein JSS82_15755 [Bacteroidetes bacterium]|nr:hypothetical protein [Bacteroidota bacterium]